MLVISYIASHQQIDVNIW